MSKTAWDILNEPKKAYRVTEDFTARTQKALEKDKHLFQYDAVDLDEFLADAHPHITDCLKGKTGYDVLDVGCGYGRHSTYLALAGCRSCLGIDPEPLRIAYAKKHYGTDVCQFEVADVATFQSAGAFDFIWMSKVLQHLQISRKMAVLQAVKGLLRPGGVFLIHDDRLMKMSLEECARFYQGKKCAQHMIPLSWKMFCDVFSPWPCERHEYADRVVAKVTAL